MSFEQNLTKDEKRILIHALTGSAGAGRSAYRNHYYACPDHEDMPSIEQLIVRGLMYSGSVHRDFYHCTESGASAVGLNLPKD